MLCRLVLLALLVGVSKEIQANDCKIWTDHQRITHVNANDQEGATYCFGYLHGRDRAWQLDYFRRTVYGTNAEVYGFSHLKGDMMMRLLDLPSWAAKLWNSLEERERLWLLRYSAGVNHGLEVAKNKPTKEFQDGYPFTQTWTPEHSIAIMLLQSFDQTRKTFFTDWEETKGIELWKKESASLFDADGTPWNTTVLKKGEYPLNTYPSTQSKTNKTTLPNLWAKFPTPFGEETGSNNWVVAPSKSRSRKAIFANDPHLDLKTPMFWNWVHLESPELDVVGASLPGIPLIVSGTNRKVSWGLTNAYINTADAVRISSNESDELETFRPVVWVKWLFFKLPIFFKSFEKTKEGYPVIPLETQIDRPLVLKWTGFHIKPSDVSFLRQMMKVSSVSEMDKVLSGVGVPSWNFVFSDIKGNIGFRTVGRAIRSTKKYDPGIHEGTLESIRNPEFYSPDEMPHLMNPKRGWVVTANNQHWPENAAFFGGRSYSQSFRAFRIEELLKATPKHNRDTFSKVQCDSQIVDARYLAPLLVEALEEIEWKVPHRAWLEKLRKWDYKGGLDCEVCPIYRRTLDLAMSDLKVGEVGFWRLGVSENKIWERTVESAFKQAWGELNGKRWADVHLNHFHHISGNEDWDFSPTLPTKGDKHSVSPGWSKWDEKSKTFDHYSGASQRLIVEMFETPQVWLTLPGLNARYDEREKARPWQEWTECQMSRVEWPVDWKTKETEKIEVKI